MQEENLLNTINQNMWTIESLTKNLQEKERFLNNAKIELEKLNKLILLNTKAKVVLQVLYEKINESGIVELCRLNTSGFNKVFNNRDYEVKYEITTERNINNLKFILQEKKNNKIINSNIRNAVGGSISSLSGLICLIFFIIKNNGQRIILLDEQFSEFDSDVIDNLFDLLMSFCKEGNFSFGLITHDTRFFDYADKIYIIENGKSKLIT